jgi:hypothetical protein
MMPAGFRNMAATPLPQLDGARLRGEHEAGFNL